MILELIGAIFTFLGSLILFVGTIGVLRMPDIYNRMQAGTKATTLGSILFFIGIAFLMPSWSLKLLILIFFIFLTNPISSHALARASHFIKIKLTDKSVHDALTEDEERSGE